MVAFLVSSWMMWETLYMWHCSLVRETLALLFGVGNPGTTLWCGKPCGTTLWCSKTQCTLPLHKCLNAVHVVETANHNALSHSHTVNEYNTDRVSITMSQWCSPGVQHTVILPYTFKRNRMCSYSTKCSLCVWMLSEMIRMMVFLQCPVLNYGMAGWFVFFLAMLYI